MVGWNLRNRLRMSCSILELATRFGAHLLRTFVPCPKFLIARRELWFRMFRRRKFDGPAPLLFTLQEDQTNRDD